MRLTLIAAFCLPSLSLAAAPAAEYPLSCSAEAKPLVFKAWDATSNSRMEEARWLLSQALAADAKCVVARANLAVITPGEEGNTMFSEALAQVGTVSEVERLDLQATAAMRDGDAEKAYELSKKALALAPNVFALNLNFANFAQNLEKWDESSVAATRATELNAKAGSSWNLLGYAKLGAKKNAEAVAAFRKYVETAPNEANGHDSLADALMANNQLEEAGAEYQKAIDSSAGKFWFSWSGVATVKALKGDWDGARAAIASQKAGAVQPSDKVWTHLNTAWTWVAQGKVPEAIKAIELFEKEAQGAKLANAVVRSYVLRGQIYLAAGKFPEALKAFKRADSLNVDGLNEGQKKLHRGLVLSGLQEAEARLGKLEDAEATLTTMEEFYQTNLTGPHAADALANGRGMMALAKKDAKAAVESFKKCSEPFDFCHLALAEAQDKAGDAAGAAATRAALRKANHRDPMYWVVRAEVEAKLKGPGKK